MPNQTFTIPPSTVTYLRGFALPGAISVAPFRITICLLTDSSVLIPEDTAISPYTSSEALVSHITEEEQLGEKDGSRRPRFIFVYSDGWVSVVVYWRDKGDKEEYWEKVVGYGAVIVAGTGLVCREFEAVGVEELGCKLEEAGRYP
ncbi:hypothetical protein TWF281_006133 [Arthrobotrys megalospora]